jgi:hypothetical protein
MLAQEPAVANHSVKVYAEEPRGGPDPGAVGEVLDQGQGPLRQPSRAAKRGALALGEAGLAGAAVELAGDGRPLLVARVVVDGLRAESDPVRSDPATRHPWPASASWDVTDPRAAAGLKAWLAEVARISVPAQILEERWEKARE